MKAVKLSDFSKYGCVACGCEHCYSDYYSGPASIVICAECHERFMVMNDSMKISNVGIEKESYDGFIIPEKIGNKELAIADFLSLINFNDEEEREKEKFLKETYNKK